jgi:hypothetical protein
LGIDVLVTPNRTIEDVSTKDWVCGRIVLFDMSLDHSSIVRIAYELIDRNVPNKIQTSVPFRYDDGIDNTLQVLTRQRYIAFIG